ncbi:hypothetical protein CMI37_23445 [Candidatus Pacearchaeota archaeon]|nr:hypothetical protein [Candidatus Pacearchaeota archaeon]|tara:strand:- start:2660 stop:3121 length:462 start_codon:yes stop_codon:yes gene_type:complete
MTDQSDLWTAVQLDYVAAGLISLTNVHDTTATSVNDTVGTAASLSVIELWPVLAQEDYDGTDAAHVQIAGFGVIALLWRRGGTATEIEKIKWSEFEELMTRLKRTNARARLTPTSNSSTTQSSEQSSSGRNIRPWSDSDSMPMGTLPSSRSAT